MSSSTVRPHREKLLELADKLEDLYNERVTHLEDNFDEMKKWLKTVEEELPNTFQRWATLNFSVSLQKVF